MTCQNSTTKICTQCPGEKPLVDFHKDPRRLDGCSSACKLCRNTKRRERGHTMEGLAANIYHHQIRNSKQRKHPLPVYTQKELLDWLFEQENFDELFNAWVESGYDKNKTPSIDRLDDYKSYTFDNIQLMTWGENHKKANADMKNGVNNKQSKGVVQSTLDGRKVAEYASTMQAARATTVLQSDISRACTGVQKTAGGYKWSFA